MRHSRRRLSCLFSTPPALRTSGSLSKSCFSAKKLWRSMSACWLKTGCAIVESCLIVRTEAEGAPNQPVRGSTLSGMSQSARDNWAFMTHFGTLLSPDSRRRSGFDLSPHQQSLQPTKGLSKDNTKRAANTLAYRIHSRLPCPAATASTPHQRRCQRDQDEQRVTVSKHTSQKTLEWIIFAPESWLIRGTPTSPRPRSLATSFLSAETSATESERAA
jgi:hypothetical protein